ncbi:MAG: hypothetical protein ABI839_07675 [Verrucomicrobiota bacterium]
MDHGDGGIARWMSNKTRRLHERPWCLRVGRSPKDSIVATLIFVGVAMVTAWGLESACAMNARLLLIFIAGAFGRASLGALMFVPAMAIGMVLAQQLFGVDE